MRHKHETGSVLSCRKEPEMKMLGKRLFKYTVMLMVCIFVLSVMAACVKEDDGQTVDGQPLDVAMDDNAFQNVSAELVGGRFLGMQFYRGEPVQLWASESRQKEGKILVTVYIYHKDGTRETAFQELDREYASFSGYLDEEGAYYSISGNSVTKLDSSGKSIYTTSMEEPIEEFCGMPDGKAVLLALSGGGKGMKMYELGKDGKSSEVKLSRLPSLAAHMGRLGEELLLMDGDYIYQVDLAKQTLSQLVSFRQTSYAAQQQMVLPNQEKVRDFYMPDSRNVEIAKADSSGSGRVESIEFKDMGEEKTVITLKSMRIDKDPWLKEQVLKFNSSNDKYYIVIDMVEDNEDWDDFVRTTGVEIATGKGPELLHGEQMLESAGNLIEKGGLENLAPLMEQSGIREEDYFPMAFDYWRTGDAVYSFSYRVDLKDTLIKREVLGEVENPDIETLVDAMLAYPEKAVYGTRDSGAEILSELFKGTETLWGMVDWEEKTCDFSGELFAKILEAAKRYQYDERNNCPEITKTRFAFLNTALGNFETSEKLKEEGYVVAGVLFDDGCRPMASTNFYSMLSINANSVNKEGAWEFLHYIMGKEAQDSICEYPMSLNLAGIPVRRDSLQAMAEKQMREGLKNMPDYEVTQEGVDEFVAYVESARALPYKTAEILEIIENEAQDYFSGAKDIPQVVDVIENRVKSYLQER